MENGKIDVENLVFLDECGVKLGASNDYVRGEGGQRVVVKEPKHLGKNISVVAAMGLSGVLAAMYCLCTFDGSGFLAFITEHLVPNLKAGQIVLMDNVSFHVSKAVRQAIEAVGASVVFLPPYSPEWNPIENLWSKIKSYLKSKRPDTLEAFHHCLVEALDSVSEYDCEGWFDHAGYIR